MKKLDCNDVERIMVTDLDEGLDLDSKELLEAHLQACPPCMRIREEFQSLFSAVAADVPPDPGELFWRRYDSTLASALHKKRHAARWRDSRWKAAGVLLAAVIAFVAVFSVYDVRKVTRAPGGDTSELVFQELNNLYGPSPEEVVPALSDSTMLAEIRIPQGDDAMMDWFDAEDESGQFWLL
ncbi:MAG TPA: zf-HC2 domain-containing protein [Desulfomonilaceae bacterium]|nr:zf-HC2 domain-containing protein [Desulfomonilaceae bacterium]